MLTKGRRRRRAAVCAASGAVAMLAVAALAETGATTVRIRSGDTLSGIASRHGLTVDAIARANGIADPDHIRAGDELTIPDPSPAATTTSYVVRPGDSLSVIAARHGVSVTQLAAANGISDIDYVRSGERLTIPAGMPHELLADPARLALAPRFAHWARTYAVPADLIGAVAWMESGWQNHVVSSVNAVGIGQLKPAAVTQARNLLGMPELDPAKPDDNIRMTARTLRWLLDSTGGDERLTIGAYFQGLRSVQERGFDAETEHYITVVSALRPRF